MHEGPGTDDSKKSQTRLRSVKHLYGDCMPIAACGALLPRNAAVNINSPYTIFSSPLSASIHRTIGARVLPARSDMPICCGVLVLACSSDTPV